MMMIFMKPGRDEMKECLENEENGNIRREGL